MAFEVWHVAHDRTGYVVTVVGDACATRDLPLPGGGLVPAAELQRAELAALGDRFARVVEAAELT